MNRQALLTVTALFAAGALVPIGHAREDDSGHVLFQAVARDDLVLARAVLGRGTPPDLRGDNETTPLMLAARDGSAEMVELLLQYGADPRATNRRSVTPLLWGASDPAKVQALLDGGADPNAASALGNTPLLVAAGSPEGAESVRILLAHGADLRIKNKSGRSALFNATEGGSVAAMRRLLVHARQLDVVKPVVREAGSAVANAAENGFHEIVTLLLEQGADPNRATGSRGHALNAALVASQPAIARTLIEHGAKLDRRMNPGDVPTVVLAAYSELDDCSIIDLLSERGADFSVFNSEHESALTWARLRGHTQMIDAAIKAGASEGTLPSRPDAVSAIAEINTENRAHRIAAAVQQSVDLLQLSSNTFLDVRKNCVSCHHQNLPGVALGWARDRGFQVDQRTLDYMADRQVTSWKPRIERSYELDSPYPVPPRFLGYGMWSFAEVGYPPDELTHAVSWYLAATQQPDGRWVPGMLRPPLGDGEILATVLGMRSLQFYPPAGRQAETAERIRRARQWLESARPRTHQETVYRMLGLAWSGVEADQLVDERQTLVDAQRDDGGWAQLPGLESDAWATGQALVALHSAGGMPGDDPVYRRGIDRLLKTQYADGSWYVQTRTWPFQPYFESKFPYGRDQWISAPATAWAVMALSLAIEPDQVTELAIPSGFASSASEPADPSPSAAILPAAATRAVTFAEDIKPLLARSCIGCHGDKDPESSFSLTSRANLLRGGDSELPSIVSGAGDESPLVRFAAGLVEEMEMPPRDARDQYPALSSEEIAMLRAWVDQGAVWEN